MLSPHAPHDVVQIGVFAAPEGWLLTHPNVQSRFDDRDEAVAAARRLAHLEACRGHDVDIRVQEPNSAEVAVLDPRQ